jgi:hypothetical protein
MSQINIKISFIKRHVQKRRGLILIIKDMTYNAAHN